MPDFASYVSFFKAKVPTSSTGHRNTERLNAGLQISSNVLQIFGPASITTKAAQSLISIHAVFREDTYAAEKILHLFQGCLSMAEVALMITLYVQDNECAVLNGVCKATQICELIYQGILLTGWGASEFSKEAHPQSIAPIV